MLKKILNIILFIIYILIVAACILGIVLYPPYRRMSIIFLVIVTSLLFGYLFLQKMLIRKKEKSFVDRIINVDRKTIDKLSVSLQTELLALQQSWMAAIKSLRASRLRKNGNPLYALPWYLVIGESRIGKSSMICHSGLSSPIADCCTPATHSITKNCDWWFFNEAIVLDTAGRYTVPIDPQNDKLEWDEFCKLLGRFRQKEPINGVVATISADRLLSLTPEELAQQGAQIRSRIDQVMRSTAAQFPVYIMVTKMDLVFGMSEFFRALPRTRLGQAMGWCNESRSVYSNQLMQSAIDSIGESLRNLQSRILHELKTPEAEVLIFPNKFGELLPGLQPFSEAIFSQNVYQVTPQFRGVYFCSALQKINQGEIEKDEGTLTEKFLSGGMFLRDFFAKILPGDRKLFSFIPEYAVKKFIDRKEFKIGWITVWLVLILLISFGYKRNQDSILPADSFYRTIEKNNPVYSLQQVGSSVRQLEVSNSAVFPLRFGMDQSRDVQEYLRDYYVNSFEEKVNKKIFALIDSSIYKISSEVSEDSVMTAVEYLTTLLGLTLDIKDDRILNESLVSSHKYLSMISSGFSVSDSRLLIRQYQDWIRWSEPVRVEQFRRSIYETLVVLLEKKGADLHWCIRYPLHGIGATTMRDFWAAGGNQIVTIDTFAAVNANSVRVRSLPSFNADIVGYLDKNQKIRVDSIKTPWIRIMLPEGSSGWIGSDYATVSFNYDTVQISGAYTSGGLSHVQSFLNKIDSTITDSTLKISFGNRKNDFFGWYWENFYSNWYSMMDHFVEGYNKTASSGIVRTFMQSVIVNDDPGMRFIRRLASELDTASVQYKNPAWRDQVLMIRDLERASLQKAADSTGTGLVKTGKSISKIFKKIDKISTELTNETASIRTRRIESAISTWNDYRSSVSATYGWALKPGGFTDFARNLFSMRPGEIEKYQAALDASRLLKGKLFDDKVDNAVWKTVETPLTILRKLAYNEANMEMQRIWERVVLSRQHSSGPEGLVDVMFSVDSGVVYDFLKDDFVSAFIVINPDNSIKAVEGLDGPLGFTREFIDYVNKGIRYSIKDQYPLTLQTIPFTVNEDALEEPYQTMLSLQCAEGSTVLENFNHYETTDFVYLPGSCGEVTLKVVFPSFTAVKTWGGRFGFPKLLQSFRDGVNVIVREDFDIESQAALERKNIKWVRVRYIIDPKVSSEISGILDNIPGKVPQIISSTW